MRSKSSLLAHHHDAPRGCDFEKSLSVQQFYCGTFNFFSTAIKAKILKRSQPKISDEDDPLSVGPVVYILKVLEPLKERLMKKKLLNSKPQPMELKISVRWSLTSKKLISWRVKKAKVSWKSGSVTGMSFGKVIRGKKSAKPRRNVDYCYFKLSSLDRLQANSGRYSI